MRRVRPHNRSAFTLVELLMVITIIGILVGLIVPAVMFAMRSVKQNAIAMEVQTLANAVDQYKNKYGDYPPDGSDSTVFVRHCRRLFPQIAPSELTLVVADSSSGRATAIMDPAEALVFFLGGFSKDPVHPFTGPGGPFTAAPAAATSPLQYNVDRNEPLYEFAEAQLTLEVFNDNGEQITISNDETVFGLTKSPSFSSYPGDLIPVFHSKGKFAPFVYFDSRTYSLGGSFFNFYNLGTGYGVARPYKASDGDDFALNTKVTPQFPASTPAQYAINDVYYRYVNDRTYQIISAGLDDSFGGVFPATNPPTFFCYPTGRSLDIRVAPNAQSPVSRYTDNNSGIASLQLDNATNFAEGILSNGLTN